LQYERTTGRCRRHRRRRSVVADVVRAERVRQSSSGRLVVAHVVDASGGRVQDGLLLDNGDEAIVVVPRHVSSDHPRHHRPCRPRPLLHRRRRRSSATLVTIATTLTALFVTALIIGHTLSLLFVTRRHARVHRPPSKLPSLVDCCFFTPAVASAVITVAVAFASATTIAATEAAVVQRYRHQHCRRSHCDGWRRRQPGGALNDGSREEGQLPPHPLLWVAAAAAAAAT